MYLMRTTQIQRPGSRDFGMRKSKFGYRDYTKATFPATISLAFAIRGPRSNNEQPLCFQSISPNIYIFELESSAVRIRQTDIQQRFIDYVRRRHPLAIDRIHNVGKPALRCEILA